MVQNSISHHDAMTIANYVIEYSNIKGYSIDNLRLQKMLYFLQCYFLTQKDDVLFSDSIKKWPYGPVVNEVYDNFKTYGPNPITSPEKSYVKIGVEGNEYSVSIKEYNHKDITKEEKTIIEFVIESLKDLDTFLLVNITHKEPSWRKYKDKILAGERSLEYSVDELKNQFSN